MTDLNRGTASRGISSRDPEFLDYWKHGIKADIETDDRQVLVLLPNGDGYVGAAWKAKIEKYEMGRRMAWERALQTGSNLTGLVGNLAYQAATARGLDGDAFSDLGAYGDLASQAWQAFQSEHPLNSQEVVNAPREYYAHGSPTHESYPRSSPKVDVKHAPIPSAPREHGGASRDLPNLSTDLPSSKEITKAPKGQLGPIKSDERSTKSIRTTSPSARATERGLADGKPKSASMLQIKNTQRKYILLDLSKERYVAPVDKELAVAEQRIGAEREAVAEQRLTLKPEDWARGRGGITKRLYNWLERRAALSRTKVWPNKAYLEQARVLGVELKNGKLVRANKISTSRKGRIADILELDGTKATMEDLKSDSTHLKSIEGGLSSEEVDAVFRPSSEIARQHKVEREIVDYAKKVGGKVLVRGREVTFGTRTTIKLDPDNISAPRVTGYNALPGQ